jgi:hypothetical protein
VLVLLFGDVLDAGRLHECFARYGCIVNTTRKGPVKMHWGL